MLDKKMDERNTNYALAKPDYRLWLSHLCLPFFLGSLGSMVLWIAQKRTCTKDLSALLNYLNNSVQNWHAPLVVSLLMPLLLLPLFQYLLNKKSAQSCQITQQTKQAAMSGAKAIANLIRHSYPALPRIWIYLSSKRFDLWICSALGAWAGYLLANTFIYDAIFAIEPALDATSSYWLLLYGILILPALVLLRLWDSAIAKIAQCYRLGAFRWAWTRFILCGRRYSLRQLRLAKSANGTTRCRHSIFSFAWCILTAVQTKMKTDKNGRVLHDIPIMHSDADLFGWGDKAKTFSREVLAAPDGMAFGVEAPWGTGKTSFINLCEKQWNTQSEDKVVIYRFELLTYAGNPNLIEQFVLGLLDELQKHYYLPELRGALQGYLGGLQGALELNGGPLKLTFNTPPSSIEEALTQVRAQLERRLPPKMCLIVIIDDLDRAPPDGVRDLLFALHKCFALPRLRYVLCYDQQQLANKAKLHHQHGGDLASQTLYEFLDKFVTARVYLHTTYQGLEYYVNKQLLPQLKSQPNMPVQWHDFILKVLEGALILLHQMDNKGRISAAHKIRSKVLVNVEQKHVYWSLLGDIRKLKWLYNQMCLCWQQGLDLPKHDFHTGDLVRLLLLQQVYPEVFRSIRAQAHSGEYLNLMVNTSGNEDSPGQGLELFITKEKSRYPINYWQQHALETLLRDLFDPNEPSKNSRNESHKRAARGYRLPEYFNLLLQEQIPALHSSQAYRTWFCRQWHKKTKPLKELLQEEVLAKHDNEAENWQDNHEYALWKLLLEPFSQYDPAQRAKLLTEFLQALPRFNAESMSHCGRIVMTSLLGQVLHTSNHKPEVRLESLHAILTKCGSSDLLRWQDAMIVYEKISDSEPDSEQINKLFWDTVNLCFLDSKVSWVNLQPLPEEVCGKRTATSQNRQSDVHTWMVSAWVYLWSLCDKQPDELLKNKLANWLFNECWGEQQPSEEQVAWWLDFLLSFREREAPVSGKFQLKISPHLHSRMRNYAQHSVQLIESVRLPQTQNIDHGDHRNQIKAEALFAALTELCEKPWDECVDEDACEQLFKS